MSNGKYLGETMVPSACTAHMQMAGPLPKARPMPGAVVVVRWECPWCSVEFESRFEGKSGDQREPGSFWARVGPAVRVGDGR